MGSNLCLIRDNDGYECNQTSDLFGCKSNFNSNDINSIYFQPIDIYQKKKIKRKRRRKKKKFEQI